MKTLIIGAILFFFQWQIWNYYTERVQHDGKNLAAIELSYTLRSTSRNNITVYNDREHWIEFDLDVTLNDSLMCTQHVKIKPLGIAFYKDVFRDKSSKTKNVTLAVYNYIENNNTGHK